MKGSIRAIAFAAFLFAGASAYSQTNTQSGNRSYQNSVNTTDSTRQKNNGAHYNRQDSTRMKKGNSYHRNNNGKNMNNNGKNMNNNGSNMPNGNSKSSGDSIH
jgi:hypothetical protein